MAMGVYVARTVRRWTPVIPSAGTGRSARCLWRGRSDVGHLACAPRPVIGDYGLRGGWGGGRRRRRLRGCWGAGSRPNKRRAGRPCWQCAQPRSQATCLLVTCARGPHDGASRPYMCTWLPCPRRGSPGSAGRRGLRGTKSVPGTVAPFRHASPVTFRSTPAHAAPCATHEAPWGAQGERLSDIIRSWAGPWRSSQPFLAGPPRV